MDKTALSDLIPELYTYNPQRYVRITDDYMYDFAHIALALAHTPFLAKLIFRIYIKIF
jgi:hypothetical protein